MSEWPGQWFSMAEDRTTDSMTSDNGILVMVGDEGSEYLWYDSNGYDPKTEVRR